jgi:hypothetical protein
VKGFKVALFDSGLVMMLHPTPGPTPFLRNEKRDYPLFCIFQCCFFCLPALNLRNAFKIFNLPGFINE